MSKKGKIFYILLGIVLILVSIAITFYFSGQIVDTKQAKAEHQLFAIETALKRFKEDHGKYPTQEEGLKILIQKTSEGRYFKNDKFMKDPWEDPVQYKIKTTKNGDEITLYSFGPNGTDEKMKGDDISRIIKSH